MACKHGITEEIHKRKTQEMGKDKKGNQQTIIHMLWTNTAIKNCHDQKFIGILVNVSFTEFIHEFDPNYQFPSEKQ